MKTPRLFVWTTAIFLSSLCFAQQPAGSDTAPPSVSEVMHFYDVMHTRDQMQNLLSAQQNQVRIEVNDLFGKMLPDATEKQRGEIQKIMEAAITDVFKNYPIDDILRDMVPIYQKHLSEADLNAIIAFFSTPVGQKLQRETPAMSTEAMRVAYARVQPRLQDMVKQMQSKIEEMAADAKQK